MICFVSSLGFVIVAPGGIHLVCCGSVGQDAGVNSVTQSDVVCECVATCPCRSKLGNEERWEVGGWLFVRDFQVFEYHWYGTPWNWLLRWRVNLVVIVDVRRMCDKYPVFKKRVIIDTCWVRKRDASTSVYKDLPLCECKMSRANQNWTPEKIVKR